MRFVLGPAVALSVEQKIALVGFHGIHQKNVIRVLELYFVYMRVRVCFGIVYRCNSLLYKLILLYKEMPAGWG